MERLNSIEDAFISYVRVHQERLQERLVESKKEEEKFLNEIGSLRQEVYDSVSSDNRENSNK